MNWSWCSRSPFYELDLPGLAQAGKRNGGNTVRRFGAADARTYTAELRVASNDPDESEYVITLQATIGPNIQIFRGNTEINLAGGTDSLGTLHYEDNKSFTYTIKNTGTATLELTGNPVVALSGTGASSITVTQPTGSIVSGGSETRSEEHTSELQSH